MAISRLPGALFVRNLVERRSLLFQLVRRDFEQRFVGSAVGWIWGVIHPLVLLGSWTFVFSVCLHQQMPAGSITSSYPLFLFAGMLPWLLFSETVQRSASSLLDQANLITKTVFPAEIVPVSIFLSSLMSHLIALALAVAAVGYGDGYPRSLASGSPVLVNGERVPLAGRVSMDMIGIDVSGMASPPQLGDPVILWGEGLPVEEIAVWADTIPYELLCGISQRVAVRLL